MLIRCRCGKKIPLPIGMVGRRVSCPGCRGPIFSIGTGRLGNVNDFAYRLFVVRGPHHVGVQIPLCGNGPIQIGRGKGMHILLPGDRVSRQHSILAPSNDGWQLIDDKSANGTFVNNKKIAVPTHLINGDLVSIGKYELVYETMRLPEDRPPVYAAPEPLLDQTPLPTREAEDTDVIELTDEDEIK